VCVCARDREKEGYHACDFAVSHSNYFVLELFRPVLYSIAGLGIAIVNDFKSIEGDRAMGLNSLPVAFGVDGAKYICAASVTLTQLGVAAYLYTINEPVWALVLLGLLLPHNTSKRHCCCLTQSQTMSNIKHHLSRS
jgi:1,4-dihydroxy-2-naphthoate octaprenyltransferase